MTLTGRPNAIIAALTLVTCLFSPVISASEPDSPATPQPATTQPRPAKNRIAPFQPGVRINWTKRQVEVDATVVLREGSLELLACSANTREHESIVRIESRPLHLFQAMGLIGLSPGHPTYWDEKNEQMIPATGDPVSIEVRYHDGKHTQTHPIERWTCDARTRKPIDPQPWVFAGSMKLENNAFAADSEGTVIAVVDFNSALIALPERHSDSNDQLWLMPDKQTIPPINTPCTLLISAGPMRIYLRADRTIELANKVVTSQELTQQLIDNRELWSTRQWYVERSHEYPKALAEEIISTLKTQGFKDIKVITKTRLKDNNASQPSH